MGIIFIIIIIIIMEEKGRIRRLLPSANLITLVVLLSRIRDHFFLVVFIPLSYYLGVQNYGFLTPFMLVTIGIWGNQKLQDRYIIPKHEGRNHKQMHSSLEKKIEINEKNKLEFANLISKSVVSQIENSDVLTMLLTRNILSEEEKNILLSSPKDSTRDKDQNGGEKQKKRLKRRSSRLRKGGSLTQQRLDSETDIHEEQQRYLQLLKQQQQEQLKQKEQVKQQKQQQQQQKNEEEGFTSENKDVYELFNSGHTNKSDSETSANNNNNNNKNNKNNNGGHRKSRSSEKMDGDANIQKESIIPLTKSISLEDWMNTSMKNSDRQYSKSARYSTLPRMLGSSQTIENVGSDGRNTHRKSVSASMDRDYFSQIPIKNPVIGKVDVTIISANNLHQGSDEIHPYCEARIGLKRQRTLSRQDTNAPIWNQKLEFFIRLATEKILALCVKNDNPNRKENSFLGEARLNFQNIDPYSVKKYSIVLEGVERGEITVELNLTPVDAPL